MRVVVGISVERTSVRGILHTDLPEPGRLPGWERVERSVGVGAPDAAVAEVLDALAAEAGDTQIDDVAVVHRTTAERQGSVTALAGGKWQLASHISIENALAAVARQVRLPGDLLVLELLGHHTAFVATGADRSRILVSDSWPVGSDDPAGAGAAIARIWPQLDSAAIRPEAVVVCGAAAHDRDIADVLRLGFDTPVVELPDAAFAVARGAALVAAEQLRTPDIRELPGADPRSRWMVPAAAVVVAAFAGIGLALTQFRDHAEPAAQVRMSPVASGTELPTTPPSSAGVAMAPEPVAIAEPPRPDQLTPGTADSGPPTSSAPRHADRAALTQTPSSTEASASAAPETTSVLTAPPAVPGSDWLFPGESPPPFGADPAELQAWWDNHLKLKERWLHGN